MGYVYLICDPETDHFKIGASRGDPAKRMKKLQTGNSSELFIKYSHSTQYPFRLETMLHNHLHTKRVLNEWFELDANDVAHFPDLCKTFDDVINSLMDNPFFTKDLK